jgi:hypothetical protein
MFAIERFVAAEEDDQEQHDGDQEKEKQDKPAQKGHLSGDAVMRVGCMVVEGGGGEVKIGEGGGTKMTTSVVEKVDQNYAVSSQDTTNDFHVREVVEYMICFCACMPSKFPKMAIIVTHHTHTSSY